MKRGIALLLLACLLTGCVSGNPQETDSTRGTTVPTQSDIPADATLPTETVPPTAQSTEETTQPTEETTQPTEETTRPTEETTQPTQAPFLVVIDAGHQRKGNYDKEPVGPGAEDLKAKVSSGTQGVATGLEEYKLNLSVAMKLQTILEGMGYRVVMVRTSHDVDISNAQRAAVANELQADAFIRIHANAADDSSVSGIMTLCQTRNNPYNSALYEQSKRLSQLVLEETVAATGAKKQFVWETDTMSGINWCQVPVTIVEMGYQSNPEEDRLLATEAYQEKIAQGIANGIAKFFVQG